MTADAALGTFTPAPSIDVSTNRFVTTGTNYSYDAAGNLSQEPIAVGSSTNNYYTYDAENHMTLATRGTSSGTATEVGRYSYDGEGHRFKRLDQNLYTVFGINGEMISDYTLSPSYSLTREYLYGPNGLLATIEPGSSTDTTKVKYTTADHLGSPRVITYGDGSVFSRHDYLPFGEEIPAGVNGRSSALYGVNDGVRQKFTSKERDTETGLDYFGARYLSSGQGRFTSPDSYAGSLFNPQSLNLYLYVGNNPLRFIDPTGHIWAKLDNLAQDQGKSDSQILTWKPDENLGMCTGPKCKPAFTATINVTAPHDTLEFGDIIDFTVGTAADLINGAVRGFSASVSGGTCPTCNPTANDSLVNLGGQLVGSIAAADLGGLVAEGGGGLTIASDGVAAEVSVPAAAAGAALWLGGVKNVFSVLDTVVEGGGNQGSAPLKNLHSEFKQHSLDYWRKQSTDDIIRSLKPGAEEELTVKADGTIMQGHHRIQVLRERGVDVDSLPRVPHQ